MPFVQRVIEPKYLSKVSLFNEDGTPKVKDDELVAVTNFTLCNALRQLAAISLVADDIFKELGAQLSAVYKRCEEAKTRITLVEEKVDRFDPKKVPVPVGDICSFAQTKEHYAAKHPMDTNLFRVDNRPDALKNLYESAAKTPVPAMRQLDRWRRDGYRSSRFFVCTPVLGARRRRIRGKVDIDIETRMPAVVEDLRRWTSDEALGDVTVGPDCISKINATALSDGDQTDVASDDEAIDHKLPSPEEQLQVVALRFPAEMVAVDVSGRNFDRMSMTRRSLMTGEVVNRTTDGDTVRRRGRTRRPRNRRRNTLAGTDQKEIQDALTAGHEPTSPDTGAQQQQPTSATVPRSKSSDLLRPSGKTTRESPDAKISRFNSLKLWGKHQYDKLRNKSADKSEDDPDNFNLYETVTMKRRIRDSDKERKSSISSSASTVMNIAVKLRDSSLQRRQRRQGTKEEPHSSSGNWSASSESGRSEITCTTHPRSSTATSSNSLNHPPSSVNSRRRFNTSGSVTSEGSTLTPDIIHDLHEDGDSVYSCDTEGYYTSFHMDSGLKTLKEEELLPVTPLMSTSALTNSAENDYELFGKGSTSTTTSSAGTVCTTVSRRSLVQVAPQVPERKSSLSKSPESSLERTGTIKRSPKGDVSPDSGHNTSSPIESVSSPHNGVTRGNSDFEFSESSDMEGAERIERIRVKTTINSSRIPSMCAITPANSDDESSSSSSYKKQIEDKNSRNLSEEISVVKCQSSSGSYKNQIEDKNSRNLNEKQEISAVKCSGGYVTLEQVSSMRAPSPSGGSVKVIREQEVKPLIKSTLTPLNSMLGKLKNFASRSKSPKIEEDLGEYVTLADVRNNNKQNPPTYINLDSVLRGTTEYVSLNELPALENNNIFTDASSLERKRQGARVMLDAEGKVVYSSDSLTRHKHTSFEPGPCVKHAQSPQVLRNPQTIRPVNQRPLSPNPGDKLIVKTSGNELVRTPAAIVHPAGPNKGLLSPKGAYVHVGGALLSPKDLREGTIPPKSPCDPHQTPGTTMFRYAEPTDPYFQYYNPAPNYYTTLPSKKSQYFSYNPEPERSVTPDITRGLHCSSFNVVGIPQEEESFRVSPIDPVRSSGGGFRASTPSQALKASRDLESKLLSPKRSTMSNEELYAVIHKSKKKLNIGDELNLGAPEVPSETSTPKKKSVETGYLGSPDLNEPKSCKDRKGPKKTSTLDFKRLLLQKSSALSSNKKVSAVEQLKRSKEQMQQTGKDMTILDLSSSPRSLVNRRHFREPPGSPERGPSTPKILSPKSQWRFNSPRSDVLSSTIIEQDETSSNASRSSLEKRLQALSVSERLSVERAKFFGAQKDEKSPKLPPTLETAF